jgi:hypothetical protein
MEDWKNSNIPRKSFVLRFTLKIFLLYIYYILKRVCEPFRRSMIKEVMRQVMEV